jgi:hypothetical protein
LAAEVSLAGTGRVLVETFFGYDGTTSFAGFSASFYRAVFLVRIKHPWPKTFLGQIGTILLWSLFLLTDYQTRNYHIYGGLWRSLLFITLSSRNDQRVYKLIPLVILVFNGRTG